MELFVPDWNQPKPTCEEAWAACQTVELEEISVSSTAITSVIDQVRKSHSNGGALLGTFYVAPNKVFDWFASRSRLLEFDILDVFLSRPDVRRSLPTLEIPDRATPNPAVDACIIGNAGGFRFESSFLLMLGWQIPYTSAGLIGDQLVTEGPRDS